MPGPSCDARAFCRIGLIRQSDYFPTQPLTSASFSETHFLAASEAFVPFLISTITLAIWPGFHWNFLKKATTSGAFFSSFGFTMRSEEHTSELQSLMRISYAVFCL